MKAIVRGFSIVRVMIRYRLDVPLLGYALPMPVRLLFWCMPWRLLVPVRGTVAQRMRLALIDLGPVFVKFGQLLSTRRDMLDDELAEQLATLLDKVPAFDGQLSKQLIEQALKQKVEEAFAEFDEQPLASASVAQVHSARLTSGESVVVKVIRPGIERTIVRDLRLMRLVARLVHAGVPNLRRLRLQSVIDEYEKTIFDELDLQREAGNASQLKRNFDNSHLLYIPKIHWHLSNRKVLVQERIHGLPVNDIEAIDKEGINREELAKRGVEIFFTQVFRDSFFHADMHPGNIFVNPALPNDPQYMAVDFGIVGSLTDEDQAYLARILLAFFNRDYRQIAQLHVDCGWLPADTKVHEFEGAIRGVSEPIFARPLAEISFAEVLLGLFHTARRFNMQVQPQLVLLQKTMLNIEGLGRQLYPQLDLWQTAQPILETWFKRQVSPKQVYKQLKQEWPDLAQQLPHLPGLVHDALQQSARPRIADDTPSAQRPRSAKSWSGLIGLGLLVAAVCVHPATLVDQLWVSPISAMLGSVGALILWHRGNR
ncbi:MAG: ubiquinone biosynthesis regulatory protein kinase UbiB [Oceanospirillaceae bacterium]|jgi:ubiquinone biosynthesis protein|nr:ubiquinone biosynthesis regulatory protein kinase UbiB [Oceanospirillaceae bacterium]MBT4442585.1 ubiquinone biosynthesis regulatory protein kinase UbiB [Oceanospirillaceae bacterium]MBT6078490.1 ubiquinone biosynthesis regulatory protein kinase UbiB [Oceanospirillaceae bacterium]